jgi:hypothetical protein
VIERHPLYCPPPIGAFTGNQAMSILERFIAGHSETGYKCAIEVSKAQSSYELGQILGQENPAKLRPLRQRRFDDSTAQCASIPRVSDATPVASPTK